MSTRDETFAAVHHFQKLRTLGENLVRETPTRLPPSQWEPPPPPKHRHLVRWLRETRETGRGRMLRC
jgi:hypothetical protein